MQLFLTTDKNELDGVSHTGDFFLFWFKFIVHNNTNVKVGFAFIYMFLYMLHTFIHPVFSSCYTPNNILKRLLYFHVNLNCEEMVMKLKY